MLDLEFLSHPVSLDKHLVYRYRSGLLIPRIFRAMKTHARAVGISIDERKPYQIQRTSLFPVIRFCKCKRVAQANQALQENMVALGEPVQGSPIVLFVPYGVKLLDAAIWDGANSRCRLIEEPEVNEQSVPTLVNGLIQSSDLFRKFPLADATPLVEYIGRKARDYRFDLQSLAVEVERMILLHVELETGRFRSPKDSDDKSSRATVHNSLIKLISMPNASNARGLVQQLGKRYRRGWGVRELVTDLAMVSSSALDRSQYQLPLLSAVVWNAALLASADGLLALETRELSFDLKPDLFLAEVDRLGMDFVKRVDLADPLQGEWAALALATRDSADVSNDDLRMMLLRSLWTALWNPILDGSFWISRLRNILSSCILHSNGASTVAPFNTPLSFDEIAGNRKVIAGLEQRLAKNNHRTALIIHGPEGVGKAYVARIYGKIFLCPNRGKRLRACGDPMCSSCPEFDAGGGFGFIDFDCAADDPDARALRLRERLNIGPWSDRRFVLIRNLDHSPTVIGPLLKVLERASDVTTFVFCVNDIRTMSDAGKSRCWIYRLSELDRGDASVLAQALLRYMAIPNLAAESFESLLTFGRGSPQRLQDGCDRIAGLNDRSISGVAAALGFAGLPWGIAYWQKICDPTSSFAEVMELPAGGTPIDAIELIQNLLMLLRDCNSGLELAAPFDRSRGHLSDLLACFRQRAAKTHMSFEQLWSAVADIWTNAAPQISDEFAFRTRLTRKKIVTERDSI